MLTLKITWKYCLAFYCIIMLYASLHELVHHFAGFIICGEWGYKSFNYFETACEEDKKAWYATYAGPLFSFIMMYWGAHLLLSFSAYKKHLGFAIIFAQLPLQRMIMPLFRMNDEFAATIHLFGDTLTNQILITSLIWIICIPPLWIAFHKIENKRKLFWFLFYFCIFPLILFGPVFATLEYLMVEKKILAQTFIGIGLLFIINEAITIAGYWLTKKYIDPDHS